MKVKLNEVCDIIKGKTTITKAVDGEYPLVVTAEGRRSNNEYQFDCKAVCVPLVSATGHGDASIKRIHYQEGKFALGTILAAVIPKSEKKLNARYLHIYLSYFKDSVIVPLMRGSANVSLTIKSLESAEIELPEIEKQLEIVEMVSLIEQKKKNLDNYLQEQENIVVNIKNEILQLAVQGKLVPQGSNDESAEVLLEKIQKVKERLIKEKKINKEKPLTEISEEEKTYELPKGWQWTRFIGVIENLTNGIYKHESFFDPNGVICLRMYNINQGSIVLRDLVRIILNEEELHTYGLIKGDLLLNRVNSRELVGKTAVIHEINEPMIYESKNIRIRLMENKILPYYLNYFLQTTQVRSIFSGDAKKTCGQASINQQQIKNIIIPLPPLAEQKRIVEKVYSLMQLCDELEKKIEKSKNYSNRLMESILKSSFLA